MMIQQGDIYWITLNPSPGEKTIAHPYVVIQDTIINQSRINTLVVCGITTNMKKLAWPGNLLLPQGEANLDKESIVDVSQVTLVDKNQLGDLIGRLENHRIEQIFAGMLQLQKL